MTYESLEHFGFFFRPNSIVVRVGGREDRRGTALFISLAIVRTINIYNNYYLVFTTVSYRRILSLFITFVN